MSFGLVGGRLLDGAHVAAKAPSFTSSFLPEESPDALVIRTNIEMVPQQRDARPRGPAAGLFGALEPPHKPAELSQAALAKKYPPEKVTIWFDLGNVVVDLSSPSGLSQMMPNAFNYILTLKSKGYQVGVMTNYGQKFFPVPLEEQQRNLQTTITRTWNSGSGEAVLDLSVFDCVLIPTNEAELKPKDPLYQMAFERSHDRPYALFIGDDLQEVEAARRNGMAAYHFPLSKKFLDPEKIPALLHRQLGQPAKPTQNVVAAPEQAASVGNAP